MFLRSCAAKNNALGVKGRKKKEVRRGGKERNNCSPERDTLRELDPDKRGF